MEAQQPYDNAIEKNYLNFMKLAFQHASKATTTTNMDDLNVATIETAFEKWRDAYQSKKESMQTWESYYNQTIHVPRTTLHSQYAIKKQYVTDAYWAWKQSHGAAAKKNYEIYKAAKNETYGSLLKQLREWQEKKLETIHTYQYAMDPKTIRVPASSSLSLSPSMQPLEQESSYESDRESELDVDVIDEDDF